MTMSNVDNFDQKDKEFKFTENNFQFIVKLVNTHTGIVLAPHKKSMVYSRLARRLRALGLKNFDDYCDYLTNGQHDDELENFMNSLTTNLTAFFRESHHFDHLETFLHSIKHKPRIRLWSAACSTGQEPYSIAAVLAKVLGGQKHKDAKILATDIDTKVLQTAKTGTYDAEQMMKVPEAYRKLLAPQYSKKNRDFTIDSKIKELITFKQLNLLHEWPISGMFDAIFCRNVVIYFDKPTQGILFNKFADHIEPNGILYIGHSENLYEVKQRFRLVGKTTYQRI